MFKWFELVIWLDGWAPNSVMNHVTLTSACDWSTVYKHLL